MLSLHVYLLLPQLHVLFAFRLFFTLNLFLFRGFAFASPLAWHIDLRTPICSQNALRIYENSAAYAK